MDEFKKTVSDSLGLKESEIFNKDFTLSDVLSISPTAINSIDLMEAFAKAISIHDLEDKLEMPVFTLEAKIDDVISTIQGQIQAESV